MATSLFETVVEVVWRQWRAIGGAAAGEPVTKQVDPEALCLASLFLQDHEPRLWVVMSDWLRHGAALLSVQRLKNLARQFPPMEDKVRAMARVALEVNKEARWKSLLGRGSRVATPRASTKHRSGGLVLTAAPSLVLRLRAAFTVGARSDLLAFLLGQPLRVSVAAAAESLGYTVPPVFRAFQDLRAAGFVKAADLPNATEYWVDAFQWYGVLGGEQAVSRWGFWRETLAYACAAFALEHDRRHQKSSDYARATALRELANTHQAGLLRTGLLDEDLPQSAELKDWRVFHERFARLIQSHA